MCVYVVHGVQIQCRINIHHFCFCNACIDIVAERLSRLVATHVQAAFLLYYYFVIENKGSTNRQSFPLQNKANDPVEEIAERALAKLFLFCLHNHYVRP